jgi:hypothetical protein
MGVVLRADYERGEAEKFDTLHVRRAPASDSEDISVVSAFDPKRTLAGENSDQTKGNAQP